MAINRQLVGALNESLTRSTLLPVLQAASPMLQNLQVIEGEYAKGAKVRSSLITPATTVDYTGADVTRTNAADAAKDITVSQAKAFNEFINIGAISTTPVAQLAQQFATAGMKAIRNDIDTYIGAQAAATTNTGTTVALSASNITTFLDEGIEALLDNHVDISDVRIFVPSYAYRLAANLFGASTETALRAQTTGVALDYGGARVVYSSNLDAGVGAGSKDAIFTATYGVGTVIGAMETTINPEPENNFGIQYKGVAVYGADILVPDAVFKTEVTKA